MYRAVHDRVLNWWNHGDQERPCLLVYGHRGAAGAPPPKCESLDDYWLNPSCHEGRAIHAIQSRRYFGEAVPYHYVDFGASALCGMQGCGVHYSNEETIWVDTRYPSCREALGASVDGGLTFTKRVRQAFEQLAAGLKGRALVGPYCIGAPCDNLAGLMGTEAFMYAMYDEPELLELALGRQLDLWAEEFSYVLSVLRPSPALPMTGWHGIAAPGSTFPIQEDIGYMLGTEHYNRFCLPGIRAMVESMEYPFFHLDGIGSLKHLEALMGIAGLKVIQWQPGEGHMRASQWYEVIKAILAGGKSCQLYVQPEEVGPLVEEVGAKGLLLIVYTGEEEAARLAERYGLEENRRSEAI